MLAVFIFGACFTLGALLVRIWDRNPHQFEMGHPHIGIACFFLGASVFGLVGTVIGIAGVLNFPSVLALMCPLIFLIPSYVNPFVGALLWKIRKFFSRQDTISLTIHIFLAWYLLLLVIVSFVWKGLYPASAEGDVWNHYLPYYREVLQTGSVGPGEVWGHYWASKAAGLTHLVGALSDEFSAQLVSWVLIVMATLIVIELLRSTVRNAAWGLFGGVIFLSGVMADPAIGAFLRHHAAATAFISFLIWASIQILAPHSPYRKTVFASALIVMFYTGLYLAQIAPLLIAFIGVLLVTGMVIQRARFAVKPFTGLLFAVIFGMLVEFVTSYISAGMPSLVTVRLFWPISDQEKFGSIVGNSGILYYIFADNDNHPLDASWEWVVRGFRLQHFLLLLAGTLGMALVAILSRIRRVNRDQQPLRRNYVPVAVLGAFLILSLIPPFVFRNEALVRLYLFLNFLVPVFVLLILKEVTDTGTENMFKRIWVGGYLIAMSLLIVWNGLWPLEEHIKASWSYVTGRLSTSDALKKTAAFYKEPERFDFLKMARKNIGPEPKIFTFTYAPGPGDAFPRPGMMSEPTYSLGPHYLELIFGDPEQAAQLLREKGIDYFHFSFKGDLFTGLAFSNLFRADNLPRYFKLAYRDGDQYLLTWRGSDDVLPLPSEFIEILELRQKAVLVYPFKKEYLEQLGTLVRQELVGADYCSNSRSLGAVSESERLLSSSLINSVDQILRKQILIQGLTLKNKYAVEEALKNTKIDLAGKLPGQIFEHRRLIMSGTSNQKDCTEALTRQLTAEVITVTQTAFMNGCIFRFDQPVCESLTHRDERIPFGVIYQSKASVSNILRLNFTDSSTD